MAEKPDTPKILSEISKSNTAKAKTPASRQQQKARRRFIIVAMLFLPAVAGVVFLTYQQVQLRRELLAFQQDSQILTQTLTGQEIQIQELQEQLAESLQSGPAEGESTQQLGTNVNQEILAIRQQLAELQNRYTTAESEPNLQWKLLEAEYLIGLAGKKLQLERDRASALALMQSADSALSQSGNSNVFAVREVISRESAQLRAVQMVDLEGVYLRIANIALQAENINLLNSMRENFENRRNTESAFEEVESSQGSFLNATLSFLRSIFVWRKWDGIPEAMLASGQDIYIKQTFELMLEQAKLAVVSGDQNLYQTSLTNATDWVQRYAVMDTVAAETILTEINELAGIDLNPSLPLINESLSLLRRLIASEQ